MKKTFFQLFAGKGGVGKSSLAAASAIHYASIGEQTLIVSIDPAHSLSDSFEKNLGSEPIKILKNLFAMELDAKKALKRDSQSMRRIHYLMQQAGIHDVDFLETLPGIDEIMAYDMLVEFIESGNYDRIIFDTAPSGHALRFLSIPKYMDEWLKKLYRVTRQVLGTVQLVKRHSKVDIPSYKLEHEERDRMSKIYQTLIDSKYSSLSVVMIPEKMCIAETERLVTKLSDYGFQVKNIVVNQLLPKREDEFLKSRRAIQQENLKIIKEKFKGFEIKKLPLFKTEVHGIKELKKLASMLY